MTLIQDLIAGRYLDPEYGMVSNRPYNADDKKGTFNCLNPSLFTAQAVALGMARPTLCHLFYMNSETEDGVYQRYPGCPGDTSHDEILGAASLSHAVALHLMSHGDRHRWVFAPDGVKPKWWNPKTWAPWKGRFLWLRPYVKFCVTKRMNVWDRFIWSVFCVASTFAAPRDTDGKMLFWTMCEKLYWESPYCMWAIHYWHRRMRWMYAKPAYMFEVYFGESHPFVKWAPKEFYQ